MEMATKKNLKKPAPVVGILRCPDYQAGALDRVLREAAEAAGLPDVGGKTVLLKPNIVFDAAADKAVTTHPAFLEAAVRLVRDLGARKILVGDSPGLQRPGFQAKLSGLGEAVRRQGAEWVDFTRHKMELPCPQGRLVKSFTVTAVLAEADCVISLPKLKTHQLMYYTGAMKNLFGLIPSAQKSPYHVRFPRREDFAAMIVDLNAAVMADYALMDAVVGMEGPGPGSGTPRQVGLVLASANLLALDLAASRIIGYPPADIPVSREALTRGLWLEGEEEVRYPRLTPEETAVPDFEKIFLKKLKKRGGLQLLEFILPRFYRKFREARLPRPRIDEAVCVRCGDCARICASQAISRQEAGMVFDYRRCIRCYCCHEICPQKAISIR